MIQLATRAVDEILPQSESVLQKMLLQSRPLIFRQSQLLWEMSELSPESNLAQKIELRKRALKLAQLVVQSEGQVNDQPSEVGASMTTSLTSPDFEAELFFLADLELQMNLTSSAIQHFSEYVQRFPKSPRMADSLRILGDQQFDRGDFQAAQFFYSKLLDLKQHSLRGYAFYKMGWCAFHLQMNGKVLLFFEKAYLEASNRINSASELSDEDLEQNQELEAESRKDLISIYIELGDHRKAISYFEKFFSDGPSWTQEYLSKLEEKGLYDRANDLYRELIARDPKSVASLNYYLKILKNSEQLREESEIHSTIRQMVQANQSRLQKVQTSDSVEVQLEKQARSLLLNLFAKYAKNAPQPVIDSLLGSADQYLSAFSNWQDSQWVWLEACYFAEKAGRRAEALSYFDRFFEKFKTTLVEPHKEELLRHLINLNREVSEAAALGDPSLEKQVSLTTQYLQLYPIGPFARKTQFLRSTTYFKMGQMQEGVADAQGVFEQNSGDELGRKSFENLKEFYYRARNWEVTYRWANELGTSPLGGGTQPSGPSLVKSSYDLPAAIFGVKKESLVQSFYQYLEAKNNKKAIEIADQLEQIAPDSTELQQIMIVRAALYMEAGSYVPALAHLDQWIKTAIQRAPAQTSPQVAPSPALSQTVSQAGLNEAIQNRDRIKAALELNVKNLKNRQKSHPDQFELQRLQALRDSFNPLPLNQKVGQTNSLEEQIQAGGVQLQVQTENLMNQSKSDSASAAVKLDAFCSVALIYQRFSNEMTQLMQASKTALVAQREALEAMVSGLQKKSQELASACLSRSEREGIDSPATHGVVESLGWGKNTSLKKNVSQLVNLLELHGHWLEEIKLPPDESSLIEQHLKMQGSETSWYTLSRTRFADGRLGLARLTLLEMIKLYPTSARAFNLLGIIENQVSNSDLALKYFKQSIEFGSVLAWANLSLFYLKKDHLKLGMQAVRSAMDRGVFEKNIDLTSTVARVLGQRDYDFN